MPASAKASAMPSPMPLVEPVTMALLSASWPTSRVPGSAFVIFLGMTYSRVFKA
jgi:hypothetical protein